jgi:isoamyl acetate esterase
VPLEQFVQNLKTIISYPQAKGQSPHIVLITPPPICEHILEELDNAAGAALRRRATMAKSYADAVRQLGSDLHIPVLDMWSLFMAKAGWKEGEPLPGSRDVPKSQVLAELMYDGRISRSKTSCKLR